MNLESNLFVSIELSADTIRGGKLMRTILLTLLLILPALAGNIYVADYESSADLNVYVVDYESSADLSVYVVDYESSASGKDECWYFVDYESSADVVIYFVDYESSADLTIYFVDYESSAEWNGGHPWQGRLK